MRHNDIKIIFNDIMQELGNPPIRLLSTKEWIEKYKSKPKYDGKAHAMIFDEEELIGDIWIRPRGKDIKGTIYHEIIHCCFPFFDELHVEILGEILDKTCTIKSKDFPSRKCLVYMIKDINKTLNNIKKEKQEDFLV